MPRGSTQQLIEVAYNDGDKPIVDREAGVIRGVKVLGRQSRNDGGKREYGPQAIKQLLGMYEGMGVNLNHPSKTEVASSRGVHDGIGWLNSPTEKPDGIYADLHLLKSHPFTPALMESAERNPKRFGLSHNAEGKITPQDGKNIVDHIEKVRSVDIVQDPATTSGLFESTQREMPMKTRKIRSILESFFGVRARKILEDDATGAPMADDDVPVGDDMGQDDQVAAAFKSMIDAVLDDATLDLKAKLKKIGDILKAQENLVGKPAAEGKFGPDDTQSDWRNQPKDTGADGGPGDGGAKTVDNPNGIPMAKGVTREAFDDLLSKSPLVKQLTESVSSLTGENARLKAEAECRALLEANERTCDAVRLKALTRLQTAEDRINLIETWEPRKVAPTVARPERSFSAYADSGVSVAAIPKDGQSLARALR